MRLFASELLKIRTAPRTVIGLLLAELAVVAVGTASTIDSATSSGAPPGFESPAERNLERDLIGAVSSSLLFALILGVLVITWEYRHGTITQTFLVTPVRERVVGIKMLAAAVVGRPKTTPSKAVASKNEPTSRRSRRQGPAPTYSSRQKGRLINGSGGSSARSCLRLHGLPSSSLRSRSGARFSRTFRFTPCSRVCSETATRPSR